MGNGRGGKVRPKGTSHQTETWTVAKRSMRYQKLPETDSGGGTGRRLYHKMR